MCSHCWLESSTIILLDDACNDVLGGLIKLCEFFYAILNYLLGPLVNFLALVDCVRIDDTLDNVLNNLVDLCRVKVHIIFKFCHFKVIINYLNEFNRHFSFIYKLD